MLKRLFSAMLLSLALPSMAHAGGEPAAADRSAQSWLQLVDAGDYAASWQQTAPLFRQRVAAEQWQQAAAAARQPLGALQQRLARSATPAHTLPGAPDGDYVVLQFDSRFAHKAAALETVTVQRDDGQWRVVGYFIK